MKKRFMGFMSLLIFLCITLLTIFHFAAATAVIDELMLNVRRTAVVSAEGAILFDADTGSVTGALVSLFVICALLVLVFSICAAHFIAKKVIAPISVVDMSAPEIDTYDELAPFVREIMRQRQNAAKPPSLLENRAATIKAITGNMREGLILTDKDGRVLSANPSARDVFRQNGFAGKNLIEVCRDVGLLQNMKLCLEGQNTEMVFENGGETYSVSLSPVYEENTMSGAVILFLNVTEKFKAEQQRKEFSANVSHELKTPLTTISAITEMLDNDMVKDENKKEFISKIAVQTKRLISIVDDIIKLSEFDEGNIKGEFGIIDVKALADYVAASLMNKAKEKNVAVTVTGQNARVNANERMLDELLYNLTDNGIKYNNDGGSVTINIAVEEGFCMITVTDTGIGIPVLHQNRVFERFYTVDKSRSKKIGGTGLGLSIVKHVAEFHKGRVEIKSAENSGTSVVCYIPTGIASQRE